MRSTKMTMALLAFLTLQPGAEAQERIERIGLNDALRRAAESSPGKQRASALVRRARALSEVSNAFANPALEVTHEDLDGYSESYVTLRQDLGGLWARSARGRSADYGVREAEAAARAVDAALVLEVQRAFGEAWAAERKLEEARRIAEVIVAAVERAEVRYAEGDLSGMEVRRLRAEGAAYARLLAGMTADMAARQARLGLLVVPEEPGARLAPSSFPEAVPTVPATVGRPAFRRAEVVAASAALESRRALEGVGASGLFDGTSVLGGLKRQSDGQDGLFLGLSVPLPIADRRAGARSVALEASRIAEAELDAVRLRTASEAVVAETTLRALLPSAERALAQVRGAAGLLESALASYEEAETSLLELIDAARTELELATMEAELRRDAWMALYTWEWARGTEPGQEVEDR